MTTQAQELNKLNKRVATEVMGEPEPPRPSPETQEELTEDWPGGVPLISYGANWIYCKDVVEEGWQWAATDFSRSMQYAIRATDKAFADYVKEYKPELEPVIVLQHPTPDWEWMARIVEGVTSSKRPSSQGCGDTAPEAIVRCLLEFVGKA